MGKDSGSAPPAPDYSKVSQASEEAAHIQTQTSTEQLDWARAQYADQAPRTQAYMDTMIMQGNEQTRNAINDRSRYESVFQPVEDQIVRTAQGWNSADRAEQQSGAAQADVASQFEAARKGATAQLESFGVDPSQTRYGALDLGTRISQASAQAAAGTNSRRDTQTQAIALQGEAANIGKSYPGQATGEMASATASGGAGINAGLQTKSTFGNMMGTSTAWGQLANQSRAGQQGALSASGDYALKSTQLSNQASQSESAGIGQLAGGALMAAALFA